METNVIRFPTPLPNGSKNENPSDIGFIDLLVEDYKTYGALEPGFFAVAVHRFGNLRMDMPKIIRTPSTVIYTLAQKIVHYGFGIKLDYTVKLGRRVRIWHHGGMVLGARSIGNDVHIRQNTTFGVSKKEYPTEKPIIGDRVDVGAGVVIVGNVTVGHDSIVGANSLVSRNVAEGTLVVGVPAKFVKHV